MDAVGLFLLTLTTPWFVSVLPPPKSILTTIHSQEKIMAALIFCSDVHTTGHSRKLSIAGRTTGVLSVSRIPRLAPGTSS